MFWRKREVKIIVSLPLVLSFDDRTELEIKTHGNWIESEYFQLYLVFVDTCNINSISNFQREGPWIMSVIDFICCQLEISKIRVYDKLKLREYLFIIRIFEGKTTSLRQRDVETPRRRTQKIPRHVVYSNSLLW